MKSTNFEQQIVLYLIKYTQCYSSYNLVKILTWKFKIINYIEIFKDLVKLGLVKKYVKSQIEHYDLTELGNKQLEEGLKFFTETLIDNISMYDEEYINILLSRSSFESDKL